MSDLSYWFGDNWITWIATLAFWFAPCGFLIWLAFRLPRLLRWWHYYDTGYYTIRTAWILSERK